MNRKKTPSWIYLTAACFLLFGGCGIVNNTQSLMIPDLIEMQKGIMEGIQVDIENENLQDSLKKEVIITENGDTTKINIDPSESLEMFDKFLSINDKQKKNLKTYAYIGMLVSFLFVLTGVLWFIPQKFSLQLAYFTLGVGILFSIIRSIFIFSNVADGKFLFFMSSGHTVGAFFHICLLVVILVNDRGSFKEYINSK